MGTKIMDVKSEEDIQAYSSTLETFKEVSIGIVFVLYQEIGKIQKQYREKLDEINHYNQIGKDLTESVEQRYNNVRNACGQDPSQTIGKSDVEIRELYCAISERTTNAKEKIHMLETLLENSQQKAKNFELQLINLIDACRKRVEDNAFKIIEYKNVKLK